MRHPPVEFRVGVPFVGEVGPQLQQARVRVGQRRTVVPAGQSSTERRGAQHGGRVQPRGVVERQQLGQHPAHGHAHHVCPVRADGVEHGQGVAGEVRHLVRMGVERPGGAAGVPVVVDHHPVPGGQRVHQLRRPGQAARVRAHDQHQRLGVGWPARPRPQPVRRGHVDPELHVAIVRGAPRRSVRRPVRRCSAAGAGGAWGRCPRSMRTPGCRFGPERAQCAG